MDGIFLPLRRYFQLSGRARRREYWLFTLAIGLVQAGINAAFTTGAGQGGMGPGGMGSFAWAGSVSPLGQTLSGLVALLVFIPSITVMVRRLHDVDRSGLWLLALLVPFVGWLILLLFMCLDGTSGTNRFGPDPKGRGLGDIFR